MSLLLLQHHCRPYLTNVNAASAYHRLDSHSYNSDAILSLRNLTTVMSIAVLPVFRITAFSTRLDHSVPPLRPR